MKIIISLILVLIFFNKTESQTYSSGLLLNFGFGISIPATKSQFTDTFYVGSNFRIGAGYIFGRYFGVRLDAQINRYKRNSKFDINIEELGTNGSMWISTGRFDFLFGIFKKCGCLQPYINLGGAFYHIDVNKISYGKEINSSETNFGGQIGVGLSYRLFKSFRIGIEGQYNIMANDGSVQSYFPINLNLIYFH